MTPRVNRLGQRFGALTILERDMAKTTGQTYWIVQCECGKIKSVSNDFLAKKNYKVRSCGCLVGPTVAAVHRKHGETSHTWQSSLYKVWADIKTRCLNPNYRQWKDYGGRGITVCQQWIENFAAFRADVGPRPSPKHTIDRIDNDRGYEPGNVRWATRLEQTHNRRISGRQ